MFNFSQTGQWQNLAGWQGQGWGRPAAVGSAYTGPGDVVSSATAWWGLRGYSSGYASPGNNPAISITDQAGANALIVNILSDGTLDVATIATWVAAHSVTTIKVAQLYDQVGTNHMTVQGTSPTLVLGPVTGLASNRPALVMGGAGNYASTASININQPFTIGAVSIRTGGTGTQSPITGNNFLNTTLAYDGGTATIRAYAGGGGLAQQNETDNAWHSFHGVFNSPGGATTSFMNVDGASGTGADIGTQGLAAASTTFIGVDNATRFLTGNINEVGVWPSALSGPNMTSLSSNQHSYWGF